MAQEYEVGFVAENAGQRLAEIKAFAKTIGDRFPATLLTGFNISLWSGSNTIGFWLVFEAFDANHSTKFQEWMNRFHIKVLEVMHKSEAERESLRNEFIFKADMRFFGAFDIDMAFNMIKQKLHIP